MAEAAHPGDTDWPASAEPVSARVRHLRRLANTVEQDDPVLACELRGIAQHESSLEVPVARDPGGMRKRKLAFNPRPLRSTAFLAIALVLELGRVLALCPGPGAHGTPSRPFNRNPGRALSRSQ